MADAGGRPAPIDPLLSLLRDCVVRIDAAGEFLGTGFIVSPQEVLTCAHVVHGIDDLHVSGDDWKATATTARQLPELDADGPSAEAYPLPDVALLQLHDAPDGLPCVRLEAEDPAADTPLRLEAFTAGEHDEPDVVSRSPALTRYEGLIPGAERSLYKLANAQVLEGYSGAPLLNLTTGGVCGLVESTRDLDSDLGGFGVPVAAICDELAPMFERNRAAQADGRWAAAVEAQAIQGMDRSRLPLWSAAVKLAGTAEDRQSDLLQPRHRVVPMVGRERVASMLEAWRDAGALLEVAFLTGGGGFGKTRLAIEACLTAEAAGWTAGLLDGDTTRSRADALVDLAGWPGRLLVAIDYAETRAEIVRELLRELQRRPTRPRARLLLICRQDLSHEQLEELFGGGDGQEELSAVLGRAAPFRLPDEELDRHELFHAAAGAFAPLLVEASVPQRHVALGADQFARPLIVSVAALLACQDAEIDVDALSEEQLLLEVLDRHEARYWQLWNDRLATGLSAEDRRLAVAIATLTGAHAEADALALVSIIPGFHDASGERKRQVARWLSSLYGTGRLDTADVIGPLEPDPLAEALVARELRSRPDLAATVLQLEQDAQVAQALTVLTRLSERRDDVRTHARAALDESLPALVDRVIEHQADDGGLLGALTAAVLALQPATGAVHSSPELGSDGWRFRSLSLELGALTVEHLRKRVDSDPDDVLPELAKALNQQSGRLTEAGRPADGLAPIEEAVEINRRLAETGPDPFRANLAGSLNNQARLLTDAGRPADGLAPMEEAVEIYRQLAKADPRSYRPNLASALNNQARLLGQAGRRADALELVEEPVRIYRALAEADPQSYRPNLATALSNKANRMAQAGRPAEGLGPIEEAIAIYLELAEAQPEQFLPRLALSLNNQANMLGDLGRPAEGLVPVGEAVDHYRQLAQDDAERFRPDLAMSLNNQANLLAQAGRSAEALEPIGEAVAYRRELAEDEPERFRPDLATSLNNLAARLAETGHPAEALAAIEEAVTYRRELAEDEPQRFRADLAGSLANQSSMLATAGRSVDALAPINGAVEIYRDLAEDEPQRFLPDLARSLNNLASLLARAGPAADPLAPIDEAVEISRELAEADPQRFRADLAVLLYSQTALLALAGHSVDGLAPIGEAVEIYRDLAKADPQRFRAQLARALNSQANRLSEAGRPADGLKAIEEAVGYRRQLAEADPQRFVPDLAIALDNLSIMSAKAGRAADALVQIEASMAATDGDWAAGILLGTRAQHYLRTGDLPKALGDALRALELLEQTDEEPLRIRIRILLRTMRTRSTSLFDQAWNTLTDDQQPRWLRHLDRDGVVAKAVLTWMNATTWEASEQALADQADVLVTDAGIAAVEHLLDANPGNSVVLLHLQLLQRAQETSVETAYREVRDEREHQQFVEIVVAWGSAAPDDEQALLAKHGAALLTEPAERLLETIAQEHPEVPAILERLGRLTLARLGDLATIPTKEALPAPPVEIAAAEPTEKTLALARIAVAHHPGDPMTHLAHAVASAATGRLEEGRQALHRCRTNSNEWERPEFVRRLTALQQAHPDIAEALGELIAELERD